jgi:hypothetical protein
VHLPLWFFHISCCSPLLAFFLSFHFHHGQEQQTQARADSSIGGLQRLGILGGVLLRVRGVSGLAAEVWTYIRAVERSGLEGSDESEYSSDEEDSSEEGGGGDGGDDDDDDDGGDGDDGDDDGSSRGGNGGGNREGSNKASG